MKDYSAIYHLITLGNIISDYKHTLSEVKKVHFNERTNNAIFQALSAQAMIFTNSFIDEYDNYFKSSNNKELNDKIIIVKKIVKPAISKIREWSGIRDFRNNVLCHNLRKNKKSVFINAEIHKYKIPNNVIELLDMTKCICLITDVINNFFQCEIDEFLSNNPKVVLKPNFSDSIINSKNDLDKIYNEVNSEYIKYKS